MKQQKIKTLTWAENNILKDINYELQHFGFTAKNVWFYNNDMVEITFYNQEELNLFKLVGSYYETDYIKFVVEI